MFQRHGANGRGRDFFIGDLHGQYALLQTSLSQVGFDRGKDRLFCVGDLIDRGPDSLACLSLAAQPWFFGVRGNHEMLAYQALTEGGKHWQLWMMNGGDWVSRYDSRVVRQWLEQALAHLPYAREIEASGGRIGMVHAEPPLDWTITERASARDKHDMLWGRSRIQRQDKVRVSSIDVIVVGHTIIQQPVCLGNVLYIDTGAFQTKRLTLMQADEVLAWME